MEILLILPSFILAIIIVVIYEIKLRKLQNNVHFYVARNYDETLCLFLGKPIRIRGYFTCNNHGKFISHGWEFKELGLNEDDYKNLKWEDKPVEVFLNMED